MRKIAISLVGIGLMIGLVGAGIGATFTDSATATTTVHVGSFAIAISSTTANAVVDGVVNGNAKTVTLTCPTIQSSVAGSCPLEFTITNMGSMPALLNVAVTAAPAAPFTDLLGAVAPVTIPVAGHQDFNGGLSWPELSNANLGSTTSITYTISASQ